MHCTGSIVLYLLLTRTRSSFIVEKKKVLCVTALKHCTSLTLQQQGYESRNGDYFSKHIGPAWQRLLGKSNYTIQLNLRLPYEIMIQIGHIRR